MVPPGVFHQRACHQVCSHGSGLKLVHELPVAVVHKANGVGTTGVGQGAESFQLRQGQAGAPVVATTALKKQEARLEAAEGLCQCLLVHMAVTGEGNLPVGDAEFLKGSLPLAPQADHLLISDPFSVICGSPAPLNRMLIWC